MKRNPYARPLRACRPTGETPSAEEMLRRATERWPLTMLRLAYDNTASEEVPDDLKRLLDDLS